MLKNWYTRLTRIASGSFGSAKEDGFSLETSLTKFERFFHFWVLVCRSFVRNRCPVRASALSYTTLIALIPMLAVAMSITSAILKSEGETRIRQFIEEFVDRMIPTAHGQAQGTNTNAAPPIAETTPATSQFDHIQFDEQQFRQALAETNAALASLSSSNEPVAPLITDAASLTNVIAGLGTTNVANATNTLAATFIAGKVQVKKNVSSEAANFIYDFAKKSYSGTLGVTGMIFLVLTAIMTLTRVEETFNDIWGVTRGRDWWSRITNYTFTITFGPIFLIVALGLMNGPNFQRSRDLIRLVPFLEPLLTSILPVLIICFTFAMFYKLVPNTKVDFSAALVGGSLAGLAWHGYNHLGWLLASRWVSANAVYGSLAIIPLLMGGLYVVWLTVLFGSQVAYAFQNRASYLQDRLVENVNQRGREFVALRLMTWIGQRFYRGQSPATIREISMELGIPSKLVQQVMRTLLLAGLVVEVAGPETGYSPARPLDTITCHHILLAMRATHGQEPATRDEPVREEVLGEFARIQAAEREAASSVTMFMMVHRAQARLELLAGGAPRKEITATGIVAATTTQTSPASEIVVVTNPKVEFPEPINVPIAAKPAAVEPARSRTDVEIGSVKSSPPPSSIAPTPPVGPTPNNDNESFPL